MPVWLLGFLKTIVVDILWKGLNNLLDYFKEKKEEEDKDNKRKEVQNQAGSQIDQATTKKEKEDAFENFIDKTN